jgi:hypothetical protein
MALDSGAVQLCYMHTSFMAMSVAGPTGTALEEKD